MRRISWKMVLFSTAIFLFFVGCCLFAVQRLVQTQSRSWDEGGVAIPTVQGPGGTIYTTLTVPEVGDVALRVRLPRKARYTDGAPVVVFIPTFFTPDQHAFQELPGISDDGFVQISVLLPGRKDRETNMKSDGDVDYGGALSRAALRDVVRYAGGQFVDTEGLFLQDRSLITINTRVVGAYAFSHTGMLLFQALAHYGDRMPLSFVVGRENPTEPQLAALEIGYMEKGASVLNPLYHEATDYHGEGITVSYDHLAWDMQNTYPYLDMNGDGRARKSDDFLFSGSAPGMFDKRVYSPALLIALRDRGVFSATSWPSFLATPEESIAWWSERSSVAAFSGIAARMPHLPVMLVFGANDSAQAAADKPHIRQAYAGLRAGNMWVRLNPDTAYIASYDAPLAGDYTEHAANTAPVSWETDAVVWGHPDGAGALRVLPLAALSEMADRIEYQVWSDNLSHTLIVQ